MGIVFSITFASPHESYIKRDKGSFKVNPGDTIEIQYSMKMNALLVQK